MITRNTNSRERREGWVERRRWFRRMLATTESVTTGESVLGKESGSKVKIFTDTEPVLE